MAKGYWITTYRNISNPDAVLAYAKLAAPALQGMGGRFVAAACRSPPRNRG